MRQSALKTLTYCILTFAVLWFLLKGRIKTTWAIAALAVMVVADQWSFVKQHVNAEDFVTERSYQAAFAPSQADERILKDDEIHFRVYNTTAGLTSDSYTSYYHKSIGGYHGAKLIRYQDLIEHQLSKGNMSCFNMLNAKWFIVQDNNGMEQAQQNPNACGTSWFVNQVTFVADADAEMAALSEFEPKSEAVVDQRFKEFIPEDLSNGDRSQIKLTSYDPRHMVYEANVAGKNAFAVFSEIYYQGGHDDWKSYIDGEEVEHIRVNYLLRGMAIPQGEHTIEFKFHPRSYYLGETISGIFSAILVVVLILTGFLYYRNYAKA